MTWPYGRAEVDVVAAWMRTLSGIEQHVVVCDLLGLDDQAIAERVPTTVDVVALARGNGRSRLDAMITSARHT